MRSMHIARKITLNGCETLRDLLYEHQLNDFQSRRKFIARFTNSVLQQSYCSHLRIFNVCNMEQEILLENRYLFENPFEKKSYFLLSPRNGSSWLSFLTYIFHNCFRVCCLHIYKTPSHFFSAITRFSWFLTNLPLAKHCSISCFIIHELLS